MEEKLDIVILSVLLVALLMMGFMGLLSGEYGTASKLEALLCVVPVAILAAVVLSPVWVGLLLGGLTVSRSFPLPILHRFQAGVLIAVFICGMAIIQSAIRRGGRPKRCGLEMISMIVLACIIFCRLIYDRPGSARLGQAGGGGEAFMFAIAVFCYPIIYGIASRDWNVARNFKVMFLIVAAMTLWRFTIIFGWGLRQGFMSVFGLPMWFLCPALLALSFRGRQGGASTPKARLLHWGLVAMILFLGVISPHRSRPFFAAGIVMGVAYVYEKSRKTLIFMAAGLILVVSLLIWRGQGQLPGMVSRSMSTVVPVERSDIQVYAKRYGWSPESGWVSVFRSHLYRAAWANICRHPIVGIGFVFSQEEIIRAVTTTGGVEEIAQALAVSGAYHNSVLELAVFCGVPAALLFVVALVLGVIRFMKMVRRIRDPNLKMMSATIFGFLVASSGQMFMNGMAHHFFIVCALLAVLCGIRARVEREQSESAATIVSEEGAETHPAASVGQPV